MAEKKKLLLLGATGMAGHMSYYYLRGTDRYYITNTVFRNKLNNDSLTLDVTDKSAVEKLIRDVQPDIIINCIGVLIKGSQMHPENAIYINSFFPHLLERMAREVNSKLIHVSTDCVFSGTKGNYSETDLRDADDTYGKSKGLGEVINDEDLTIRTSIIGPELKGNGEGLFHWYMHQSGEVNGFTETFWSGVTTLELARAIDVAIEQNITGLIHLTNGEKISKYDLLKLIAVIWKKDNVIVKPYPGKTVDKSLKKSDRFRFDVSDYKQMLIELYKWMSDNPGLYSEIYRE